jgi:hypothetical protein
MTGAAFSELRLFVKGREGEEQRSLHELPRRACRTFSDRCRESVVGSGTSPLFSLESRENEMLNVEV